ncbi:MAG: hypothetical protein BGO67_07905 [Alphaproteobacteria bacterium 41-28]|nr:MAG: hypothetical protein BGO67_07905 [Alphaproteobacteria bacterium 41-28]
MREGENPLLSLRGFYSIRFALEYTLFLDHHAPFGAREACPREDEERINVPLSFPVFTGTCFAGSFAPKQSRHLQVC